MANSLKIFNRRQMHLVQGLLLAKGFLSKVRFGAKCRARCASSLVALLWSLWASWPSTGNKEPESLQVSFESQIHSRIPLDIFASSIRMPTNEYSRLTKPASFA